MVLQLDKDKVKGGKVCWLGSCRGKEFDSLSGSVGTWWQDLVKSDQECVNYYCRARG